MVLSEADQDGHLVLYNNALPQGRSKRILHVNGVASDMDKHRRDIEALVWLTLERSFDVIGIHNSTQGVQADLTESLLGKAELYRFWPQHKTVSGQKRLSSYAEALRSLCDQSLAPDADILTATKAPVKGIPALDMDLLRRLTSLQSLGWEDLENTLYGTYPPGAPRPTLRLAYEIVNAIRAGHEVYVVAHSQGLIITALALHIVQEFFENYPKWTQTLRVIGFGPAIMFEDLPVLTRSQTILIQHRQDHVAESFSNLRNVNLWNNLQNQARNLMDRADSLIQIMGVDSHHSASVYLGLTGDPVGDRSAKLIQQLLIGQWESDPVIQSLRSTRIILEVV